MSGGTVGRVAAARVEAQLLGTERATDAAGVVGRLGALQAQDLAATALAVRARTHDLVAADLGLEGPAFVRIWLMRGTLHLVAAEDAGWMLGLLGPLNRTRGARRRAQLGLDDTLCDRAVEALPEALAGGPLGREELVARLAALGVVIDPTGQAPAHLLAYAAAAGVLCLGPEVARGKASYRLLHAGPPRADALPELARRYLNGHRPADPADFAAWSGLPARDAKAAFTRLAPASAATAPAAAAAANPRATGTVRMVGHFDPYLLGYADKTAAVPASYVDRVRTGGGFVTPTVLVDGIAVATWRLHGNTIALEPFEPLSDAVQAAVASEVDNITRFLGLTRPGRSAPSGLPRTGTAR
ncbi:winged helix DNA-binding domain-containing protein [Cryptosporangium sp. NPDC051539]|uniref:winged helix DNA-binding domain-containing protein n=1 Tax=Cryptosporangium sp. NPDC051539 TaxID=3363962 RepID=UPI0037960313